MVAVSLSIALLGIFCAQAVAASPLQLTNLQVSGGEESWHPSNGFHLSWTGPRGIGAPVVAAAHYRIRTHWGAILVDDTRLAGDAEWIDNLQVPNGPGEYIAEIWLEDTVGNQGPPAQATLRFDDVRPQSAVPLPDSGWINRNEIPFGLHVGHPGNLLPVSGIRGYAVSLDRNPTSEPCASADRCTDAETDLHGGIDDDSFPVFDLPEGVSYVHTSAVSGSGMRSAETGHAMLRVDKSDPVAVLGGAPGGWTDQPVVLTATATDAQSGMQPADGGAGPFTAIRVDGAAPVISVGDSVTAAVTGEGAHTVAYYARDLAGNVDDGAGPDRPPSIAVVRIDRTAPAVAFANSQDPADPELIEARVSDPLSRPDASHGQIDIRRLGSGNRFEPLPTEAGGTLRARWDSESYPPGQYEFRAIGFDAAGNPTTTLQRDNGTSMVLPNPLKIQTALHAGFGARALVLNRCRHRRCRRDVIRRFDDWRLRKKLVPYGSGVLYSGQLRTARAGALADMPVRVIERFPIGASQSTRVTTVRTDGDGVFAVNLLPGPSRQVTAAFQGTRTLTGSGAEAAQLGVRGAVRMSASSSVATVGGQAIVFRGRVEAGGATIPSSGESVQLQFHLPTVPWTEFRTVQTDARGRFRYAYRFTDNDSRGVRFRFRAFVPAQNDWPYEPAGSRPVAVRGR
jgi:hypothetical protein